MIYLVTSDRVHFRSLDEQRQLGRYLLRLGLQRTAGLTLGDGEFRHGRWGKPYLANMPGIDFSISHCPGGAAVAIAPVRTGIDIERVRPHAEAAAQKALSEAERRAVESAPDPDRAFFRLWTLKESYLKALGIGMALPLNRIGFQVEPDLAITTDRRGCRFRLVETAQGYVAAICQLTGPGGPLYQADEPLDETDEPLALWELP